MVLGRSTAHIQLCLLRPSASSQSFLLLQRLARLRTTSSSPLLPPYCHDRPYPSRRQNPSCPQHRLCFLAPQTQERLSYFPVVIIVLTRDALSQTQHLRRLKCVHIHRIKHKSIHRQGKGINEKEEKSGKFQRTKDEPPLLSHPFPFLQSPF